MGFLAARTSPDRSGQLNGFGGRWIPCAIQRFSMDQKRSRGVAHEQHAERRVQVDWARQAGGGPDPRTRRMPGGVPHRRAGRRRNGSPRAKPLRLGTAHCAAPRKRGACCAGLRMRSRRRARLAARHALSSSTRATRPRTRSLQRSSGCTRPRPMSGGSSWRAGS
jgi:hypothetical protein